jgi:hypothetical protein
VLRPSSGRPGSGVKELEASNRRDLSQVDYVYLWADGVQLYDQAGGPSVPITMRSLTLTLGSGVTAQSCLARPTDATRSASCSLVVNQPLGPGTVTASFLGDPFYLPSSETKATIMFGFPAFGDFVIGDGNVQVAADDTFWGAQWSSNNTLSGGPAPQSSKGFASDTNEPPTCSPWTADPGNSGNPPDQVLSYMGVIVSSAISKSGPTVNGDTVEVIVVKTDPGYQRNPGHAGTGAVVASPSDPTQPAVYCHV